jgi:hypothetical protein
VTSKSSMLSAPCAKCFRRIKILDRQGRSNPVVVGTLKRRVVADSKRSRARSLSVLATTHRHFIRDDGRSELKARDKRYAEKHHACRDLIPGNEESEAWHWLTQLGEGPSSLQGSLACASPSPDRAQAPQAAAVVDASKSQSVQDQDRPPRPERPLRSY